MIADYIHSLLPSTLPVVTGDLPATADTIVGIIEYDSSVGLEYFGPRKGSTIASPIVKVVVRHRDYAEGSTWITQIKDTLHRYQDKKLLSVLATGSPIYLGRSAEKLHEFQVTFIVQVEE